MTFKESSSSKSMAFSDAWNRAVAKVSTKRNYKHDEHSEQPHQYHRTMSVEDFQLIPKHNGQRSTLRHAKKLLRELKLKGDKGRLDEVAIAVFPDGRMEVLNGHSRRYLWLNLLWPAPASLKVTFYPVSTQKESDDLYDTFDPEASKKDSRDNMESAANKIGWEPRSSAFKNGGGKFVMKNSFAIYNGLSNTSSVIEDEAHKSMLDDMRAVDEVLAGHTTPHSFILSGALLTHKIFGEEALDFLADIVAKTESLSSAPHQHVLKLKGIAGEGNVREALKTYWAAFDAFRRGKNLKQLKAKTLDLKRCVTDAKEKRGLK